MQRRHLLQAGLAALSAPLMATTPGMAWAQTRPLVEVWKDPNCGCCKDWMAHLEASGFAVKAHDVGNTAARRRLGLPDRYGSCHTATVGGYVVEGHVPAADIQRLLRDNRDGARQGFPIAVVDDLLMLMAVLEDQLGPYTGSVDIPPPAAVVPERPAPAEAEAATPDEPPIDFSAPLEPDTDTDSAEPIFDLDDADIPPSLSESTLPDLDFHLESGDTPPPEGMPEPEADTPAPTDTPPTKPAGLDGDGDDDGFTATELLGGFNRKRDN